MDSFLETYNQPRLNHEEKGSLNGPVGSKKIELIIKTFSKKNLEPDGSTGEFYQTFEQLKPILLRFQEIKGERSSPSSL